MKKIEVATYETELYQPKIQPNNEEQGRVENRILNIGSADISEMTFSELNKELKNNKALGLVKMSIWKPNISSVVNCRSNINSWNRMRETSDGGKSKDMG